MARKARSAKGVVVDFDLLAIKAQQAQASERKKREVKVTLKRGALLDKRLSRKVKENDQTVAVQTQTEDNIK